MAKKRELSQVERKALAKKLSKVSVSARKRKIYECKYGLIDGSVKSNREVGKRFKVTAEAIRLSCKQVDELLTK